MVTYYTITPAGL